MKKILFLTSTAFLFIGCTVSYQVSSEWMANLEQKTKGYNNQLYIDDKYYDREYDAEDSLSGEEPAITFNDGYYSNSYVYNPYFYGSNFYAGNPFWGMGLYNDWAWGGYYTPWRIGLGYGWGGYYGFGSLFYGWGGDFGWPYYYSGFGSPYYRLSGGYWLPNYHGYIVNTSRQRSYANAWGRTYTSPGARRRGYVPTTSTASSRSYSREVAVTNLRGTSTVSRSYSGSSRSYANASTSNMSTRSYTSARTNYSVAPSRSTPSSSRSYSSSANSSSFGNSSSRSYSSPGGTSGGGRSYSSGSGRSYR